MTAIILPRQHYTQPVGRVEVDWTNDLLRDYDSLWLPTDPINIYKKNGTVTRVLSLGGTEIGTPFGVAHRTLATATGYVSLEAVPTAANFVVAGLFGNVSEGFALSSRTSVAASSSGIDFLTYPAGSAIFRVSSGTRVSEHASGPHAFGTYASLFGFVVGADISRFFVNGVQYGYGAPGATLSHSQTLRIGCRGTTYSETAVGILLWGTPQTLNRDPAYQAGLSSALSDNPWQIFRADPVRIYSLGTSTPSQSSVVSSVTNEFDIRGLVSLDSESLFNVNSSVNSENNLEYLLRGSLLDDCYYSYLIRGNTTSDSEVSYFTRGFVQNSSSNNYNVRSSLVVSSEIEYKYNLAVFNDAVGNYEIVSASSVANNLGFNYNVRSLATSDALSSYLTRGFTSATNSTSYSVRDSISNQLQPTFVIRSSQYQDTYFEYNIENSLVVVSDIQSLYKVNTQVQSSKTIVCSVGYEISLKFSSYVIKQEKPQEFIARKIIYTYSIVNNNNNNYEV